MIFCFLVAKRADKSAVSQAIEYSADVQDYYNTDFEKLAKERFGVTDDIENTLKKQFRNRFGNLPPNLDGDKRVKLVIVSHNLTLDAQNYIDKESKVRDVSALLFEWFSNQETSEEFILFHPYPPAWNNEQKQLRQYGDISEKKSLIREPRLGFSDEFRKTVSEKVSHELMKIKLHKIRPKRKRNRNIDWEFVDNKQKYAGNLRLRWRRGNNNLQFYYWDKDDNKIVGPIVEKNWNQTTITNDLVQGVVAAAVKFAKSQIG